MPYVPPADVDERPVVIDGAGTLGRRIASVYVDGGSDRARACLPTIPLLGLARSTAASKRRAFGCP